MNYLKRYWMMIQLYWKVVQDKRTPGLAKALPLLSILYLIWPLDILPDIFPIVGQVDDLLFVPYLLLMLALHITPENVKNEAKGKIIDVEPK
jgi:uncharacterized membrane protein YkvA (DUF1232 family)